MAIIIERWCVYKHISPSSKVYIGITCQKPNERWRNGKGYRNNKYFSRAINKYGWDNFSHIIVAKGLSEDEAKWLEIQLIAAYDSTNPDRGYNISKGGDGANGCHHTEEAKKRIGDFHRGKSLSEEHKKKISTNHARYNLNRCGESSTNWGNRGKSNPLTKIVLCLTTGKCFWGNKEAEEYYGLKAHSHISCCCNGKRAFCGKHNGVKLRWTHLKGNILLNFNHNKKLRKVVR